MAQAESLQALHRSLDQRWRPEDVAAAVVALLGRELSGSQRKTLEKAAKGSLPRTWEWSSMSSDFARPVGMARQLRRAKVLFAGVPGPDEDAAADAERMLSFVQAASSSIHKKVGRSDFKSDRLDRKRRKAVGLGGLSKRRYNKLFRILRRMESKRARMMREGEKRSLVQASKSRLASRIPIEEFSKDLNTAAFIAYFTARSNLRSVFSGSGQKGAYDEIADMLFRRCERSSTTNWWAIAHVHPAVAVVTRLTDEQRGRLVGVWFNVLEQAAGFLKSVWATSALARDTMIVRPGNDSSTWNTAAGAWNKARDAWLALLTILGSHDVLAGYCPGKVPRLIAADVAAWHRSLGKDMGPDVKVWRELPLPWEVLEGAASCPQRAVEAVCARVGIDPVESGWTGPRPPRGVEPYQPTPELVHGVTVASPRLAKALRDAGWFSGRSARWPEDATGPLIVFRDPEGFALGATDDAAVVDPPDDVPSLDS